EAPCVLPARQPETADWVRREPASRLGGGFVFDRTDDRRENGSAGAACNHLGNDATNAQVARLRCRHDRWQRESYDLAEHPTANQAGNNVADRPQIEIWGCFADARTAERASDEVDQNLFHRRISSGWVDRFASYHHALKAQTAKQGVQ